MDLVFATNITNIANYGSITWPFSLTAFIVCCMMTAATTEDMFGTPLKLLWPTYILSMINVLTLCHNISHWFHVHPSPVWIHPSSQINSLEFECIKCHILRYFGTTLWHLLFPSDQLGQSDGAMVRALHCKPPGGWFKSNCHLFLRGV